MDSALSGPARIHRRVLLIAASAILLSLAMATFQSSDANAAIEGTGWELSAATYPTNLVQGVDSQQEVVTSEEAGSFTLSFEGHETPSITFGASVATVQADLDALVSIGPGGVSVAAGASPGTYIVTFQGVLGSANVPEIEAPSGASVTVLRTGSASGTIGIDVFNIGARASEGAVTVTDVLPPGLKAKQAAQLITAGGNTGPFGIDAEIASPPTPEFLGNGWNCTGDGPGPASGVRGATVVTCTNSSELANFQGGGGTPTETADAHAANPQPPIGIAVEATGEASGLKNQVSIAGGNAPEPASTEDTITASSAPASGGLVSGDAWFSTSEGRIDTQAGSHPYTATFVFNVATALNQADEPYLPGGEIRKLETRVPPGFIGDLHNIAQCTRAQLRNSHCPPQSMVGLLKASSTADLAIVHQVFNMAPQPGVPAELGFEYANVPVYIGFSVKSGGDYAVVAHADELPQRNLYQVILTLWGVPAERSHDHWRAGREGGCTQEQMERPELTPLEEGNPNYCSIQQGRTVTPFLTLPTSCGEAQEVAFRELGGWTDPDAKSEASLLLHDSNGLATGFNGCGSLTLNPSVSVSPEINDTDTATGLTVDVKPPLSGLEEPEGLSSADIQDAAVTLPEGLVINPGQAAGLQACGSSEDALTTELERQRGEENDGPAHCPAASKVATATIKSPLIEGAAEKQFEGNVYVLQSNPPEIKLLVAASADGVNVKLVGVVHLNEQTGRIETRFEGTPQLPFNDFKLTFEGGAKAALDTPTQCGDYEAGASFTPWSSPPASAFSTNAAFALVAGPNGGACPSGALPFAPSFTAGTTNTEAGGFTDFSTLLQRGDGQQRLAGLQFKSPAGLSALTSSVPLCGEADANAGTCPAASHIGHAIVESGAGSSPLVLPQPGQPELPIYLTGPYKGAPFGLSIVTPVLAGPFNLGTIVTRARIDVDPVTAQITVTTDPLPQIVKGVPTDIRSIDAVVDRPDFFFNPTNCTPQQFSGTVTSAGGATAAVSSRFAAGACQALKFTPHLTASSSAKTSKANGASLHVKIAYPPGAQADIARVDLTIPAILPTRLTTIQQACTEAKFNANPATCPGGSLIASAIVHTPVIKSPLAGPVYFVSHGNAAFPDVEMILQGEGVTLIVDGKTQIKKGVTFSHFESVPDEPFSSFEFTAPEGPHSIFTANGDLCGTEVKLPTTLTGQNGAVLTQSTPVQVEGCSNALKVVSHSIKKRAIKLKVIVPTAGKLTATGAGLAKASKSATGRETLTLTVKAKKSRGALKTKLKLSFTPTKKGRKLGASVAVRLQH
jgi:hypothetical protein